MRRHSRRLAETQAANTPVVTPTRPKQAAVPEPKAPEPVPEPAVSSSAKSSSTRAASTASSKSSNSNNANKATNPTGKRAYKRRAATPDPNSNAGDSNHEKENDEDQEEAKKVISRLDQVTMAPYPYKVIDNVPVTESSPDYTLLTEQLDLLDSGSLNYTLQKSRNAWLSGDMFQKYWIRPPKGKKAHEAKIKLDAIGNLGGGHARDKMARLHEGKLIIGPHTFEVRLFTAKDELPESEDEDEEDEEEQRKEQEKKEQANIKEEPSSTSNSDANTNTNTNSNAGESLSAPDEAAPVDSETQSSDVPMEPSKELPQELPKEPSEPPKEPSKESESHQLQLDGKVLTIPEKILKNMVHFYETVPDLKEIRDKIIQAKATDDEIKLLDTYREKARQMPAPEGFICPDEANSHSNANVGHENTQQGPSTVSGLVGENRVKPSPLTEALTQDSPAPNGQGPLTRSPTIAKTAIASHIPKIKPPKPVKPIPKKYLQKILTIFEFKENPSQRFIIPKNSILEALPTGELLISHLLVKTPPELPPMPDISAATRRKAKGKSSRSNRKTAAELAEEERVMALRKELSRPIYTPITMCLTDIPRRVILTVERSVNKYRKSLRYMEKIIKEGIRTTDYSVWYHIDKADKELEEVLEEPPSPPPGLVFPTKRHYKTRKRKGENAEENNNEENDGPSRKRAKGGDDDGDGTTTGDSKNEEVKQEGNDEPQTTSKNESEPKDTSGARDRASEKTATEGEGAVPEPEKSDKSAAAAEPAAMPKSKFFEEADEARQD